MLCAASDWRNKVYKTSVVLSKNEDTRFVVAMVLQRRYTAVFSVSSWQFNNSRYR